MAASRIRCFTLLLPLCGQKLFLLSIRCLIIGFLLHCLPCRRPNYLHILVWAVCKWQIAALDLQSHELRTQLGPILLKDLFEGVRWRVHSSPAGLRRVHIATIIPAVRLGIVTTVSILLKHLDQPFV